MNGTNAGKRPEYFGRVGKKKPVEPQLKRFSDFYRKSGNSIEQ